MSAIRNTPTESNCQTDLHQPGAGTRFMDRKSIERFKRALQERQRELRLGLAQTQRESRSAQHDYGKDEGDRANTSLAKEIYLGQKSRDRALLGSVDAALKR